MLLTILAVLFLTLVVPAGWLMTVLGLPGNWVIIVAVGLYAYLVPEDSAFAIGWPTVMALAAMALVGEGAEFLAGAWSAHRAGASRTSIVLATVGSLVGSLVGATLGLPLPVIGWVLGAVVFSALGALAGAVIGEAGLGRRSAGESWTVGEAAFWGRIGGAVGKLAIASAMVALTATAVLEGPVRAAIWG